MTPHIPNTTRSSARLLCVCKNCGKEFHEYRSRVAAGRGLHCSHECADMAGRPKRSVADRLWEKVDKSGGSDACWVWTGATVDKGYGVLHYRKDGKDLARGAHIFSWELTNGPIPNNLWVLHRCDNPPCVNPTHLFLGDVYDNNEDMRNKGRHAFGERNGHARLTEDDVRLIRSTYIRGQGMIARFATQFGVSIGCISAIITGENWRHLK